MPPFQGTQPSVLSKIIISEEAYGSGMRVNGNVLDLTSPMTVKELIASNGFREDRVAVELNGKIVPRSGYDSVVLKDDDSVEIVGFVGGG